MGWIVNGKQMTDAEYEEYQRQEQEAKGTSAAGGGCAGGRSWARPMKH